MLPRPPTYIAALTYMIYIHTLDTSADPRLRLVPWFVQFRGCTQLRDLVLPAALTAVCNGAFDGSTALKRLVFPATLCALGGWAFQGLTSLTELDLSAALGLTTIPYGAFAGNTALAKLALPRALTTISTTAFYRCIRLYRSSPCPPPSSPSAMAPSMAA